MSEDLTRFYGRLKGELVKASEGMPVLVDESQARAALHAVEVLMPLLRSGFVGASVEAVRTLPKVGPLGYGDVRSGVLGQLRAKGSWMTYREIADGIVAKERLQLTPERYRHFLQKLREATHALAAAGAVERERELGFGSQGAEQRWRLSQTLFRRG